MARGPDGGGGVMSVWWCGSGGWEAGYDVRRRWACLTVVAGVSYAGEKGGGVRTICVIELVMCSWL